MRFFVDSGQYRNGHLRWTVAFFLSYAVLHWLTNAFMYFEHMGLSPASVTAYYRGDEEKMLSPRSFRGMIEVAHFHLFAMGIFILTIVHLAVFMPLGARLKAGLIATTFSAALAQEGSGWLVRFVHPGFAPLKVVSFLLVQVSLAVVIGIGFHSVLSFGCGGKKGESGR